MSFLYAERDSRPRTCINGALLTATSQERKRAIKIERERESEREREIERWNLRSPPGASGEL